MFIRTSLCGIFCPDGGIGNYILPPCDGGVELGHIYHGQEYEAKLNLTLLYWSG